MKKKNGEGNNSSVDHATINRLTPISYLTLTCIQRLYDSCRDRPLMF